MIPELLAEAGITEDTDLITGIITSALDLGRDHADRLDLKITRAAVAEMRDAFRTFAPFAQVPKVTVFGSARTLPDDPLYAQTSALAGRFAEAGWMVVTGAGPGVMQAAAEGAGRDHAIGVSIRLPFEPKANALFDGDAKHVSMKYFFTRKLMLVKASSGFVCLPGGFGTLDETLELLTLQATGKSVPAPIVLLDVPGGTFWQGFGAFVSRELEAKGYISPGDMDRVLVTDSPEAAMAEITGFWRNYRSSRWYDDRLVLTLAAPPTADERSALAEQFRDALLDGGVDATDDGIALRWNPFAVGELHRLIRAVNALPSAPAA